MTVSDNSRPLSASCSSPGIPFAFVRLVLASPQKVTM